MKTLRRIEIVAILLFVAVIIFASFFGVYKKEDFRVVNLIKDYNLGMQFTDAKVLKMTVSDEENEVIYDSEGNVVKKDENTEYTEENGYTVETTKVNPEEALTEKNYKLTKKILKNRLKGMGVGEYSIDLNNETGEISVKIQENDDTEEIIYYLKQEGKFTIIDKETEDVLLDNGDVKKTTVVYGSSDETGTSTTIYLQIEFNSEGAKKLEEISKTYIKSTSEEVNDDGELEEVDNTKYVSVLLDGDTLTSTYFGETMSTGILYIQITTVTDNETLQLYSEEIGTIASIINNGALPLEYEYEEEPVETQINKNMIFIGITIPSALLLVACIVLTVKFKAKGFIATFLQIGYIAILLLAIRYTNVILTIEGVIGIILAVILNYIFVYVMLNNLKKKGQIEWNTIGKFALKTIPVYVIAVVLAFNSLTRINSLGMALVWGSFCLYIYNLLITRNALNMQNK